ncbi:hypothetical protein G8770_19210 [Aestuariicella hydrocarbonica]|uniref:Uncharacterized protein n=1 Tax=Pseudomaricurvus hydrocarbonicus TaxID=1470433 RepID=A0A9E5T2C0_9GAMM|nr:hypothetical protein [Aestuariicella hydrocarbonica]NHO67681.1 hypothetical protein [Aestuariicella hydrocarbonica]
MSIINSQSQLEPDIEYSTLNSEPDDFLISKALDIGRPFCSDPTDRVIKLIDDSSRFSTICNVELNNELLDRLKKAITKSQHGSDEDRLAREILSILESRIDV